jgi:hypothetical protein
MQLRLVRPQVQEIFLTLSQAKSLIRSHRLVLVATSRPSPNAHTLISKLSLPLYPPSQRIPTIRYQPRILTQERN